MSILSNTTVYTEHLCLYGYYYYYYYYVTNMSEGHQLNNEWPSSGIAYIPLF